MSLRGATGDEAISFSSKDCFAPLAMTQYTELADTLYDESFPTVPAQFLPTSFRSFPGKSA